MRLLSVLLVLCLVLGAVATAVAAKDDDDGRKGDGKGKGEKDGREDGQDDGERDDEKDDEDEREDRREKERDDREREDEGREERAERPHGQARAAASQAPAPPVQVRMTTIPGVLVVAIVATGDGLAAQLPDVGSKWTVESASGCSVEGTALSCPGAGAVQARAEIAEAPGWAAEASARVAGAEATAHAGLLLLAS